MPVDNYITLGNKIGDSKVKHGNHFWEMKSIPLIYTPNPTTLMIDFIHSNGENVSRKDIN